MKVIFYVNPFYGHINPTLGLIKELVDRGEEVFYYSLEPFRNSIESMGAKFICYKNYGSNFEWGKRLPAENFEKQIEPQYIVYDYFECLWGKMIGQKLGVPIISSITSIAIADKMLDVCVSG